MALGTDLMYIGLTLAGGYILIAHVLPNLSAGRPPFEGFGEFIPTPAAAAATGHRCWVVNPTTGQSACACAGKQHTVMGPARTCPDCIQYCNTGVLPDAKRITSNPTPPKQVNIPTGSSPLLRQCTVQQHSANCFRNTACQFCWISSNKSACTPTQSCDAARSTWLSRFGSPGTAPKPVVGGGRGSWSCKVTATGATGKRWVCRNMATSQSVIQPAGWLCNGGDARVLSVGAVCTTMR